MHHPKYDFTQLQSLLEDNEPTLFCKLLDEMGCYFVQFAEQNFQTDGQGEKFFALRQIRDVFAELAKQKEAWK